MEAEAEVEVEAEAEAEGPEALEEQLQAFTASSGLKAPAPWGGGRRAGPQGKQQGQPQEEEEEEEEEEEGEEAEQLEEEETGAAGAEVAPARSRKLGRLLEKRSAQDAQHMARVVGKGRRAKRMRPGTEEEEDGDDIGKTGADLETKNGSLERHRLQRVGKRKKATTVVDENAVPVPAEIDGGDENSGEEEEETSAFGVAHAAMTEDDEDEEDEGDMRELTEVELAGRGGEDILRANALRRHQRQQRQQEEQQKQETERAARKERKVAAAAAATAEAAASGTVLPPPRPPRKKRRQGRTAGKTLPLEIARPLEAAKELMREGDFDAAMDQLSFVAPRAPQLPDPYFLMSKIYQARGDTKAALNLYIVGADLTPKAYKKWKKVCAMAMEEEAFDQALSAANRLLKQDKTSETALSCRAHVYATLNEYKRATEAYNALLESHGGSNMAYWLELGELHMNNGRPDKAIQTMEQCAAAVMQGYFPISVLNRHQQAAAAFAASSTSTATSKAKKTNKRADGSSSSSSSSSASSSLSSAAPRTSATLAASAASTVSTDLAGITFADDCFDPVLLMRLIERLYQCYDISTTALNDIAEVGAAAQLFLADARTETPEEHRHYLYLPQSLRTVVAISRLRAGEVEAARKFLRQTLLAVEPDQDADPDDNEEVHHHHSTLRDLLSFAEDALAAGLLPEASQAVDKARLLAQGEEGGAGTEHAVWIHELAGIHDVFTHRQRLKNTLGDEEAAAGAVGEHASLYAGASVFFDAALELNPLRCRSAAFRAYIARYQGHPAVVAPTLEAILDHVCQQCRTATASGAANDDGAADSSTSSSSSSSSRRKRGGTVSAVARAVSGAPNHPTDLSGRALAGRASTSPIALCDALQVWKERILGAASRYEDEEAAARAVAAAAASRVRASRRGRGPHKRGKVKKMPRNGKPVTCSSNDTRTSDDCKNDEDDSEEGKGLARDHGRGRERGRGSTRVVTARPLRRSVRNAPIADPDVGSEPEMVEEEAVHKADAEDSGTDRSAGEEVSQGGEKEQKEQGDENHGSDDTDDGNDDNAERSEDSDSESESELDSEEEEMVVAAEEESQRRSPSNANLTSEAHSLDIISELLDFAVPFLRGWCLAHGARPTWQPIQVLDDLTNVTLQPGTKVPDAPSWMGSHHWRPLLDSVAERCSGYKASVDRSEACDWIRPWRGQEQVTYRSIAIDRAVVHFSRSAPVSFRLHDVVGGSTSKPFAHIAETTLEDTTIATHILLAPASLPQDTVAAVALTHQDTTRSPIRLPWPHHFPSPDVSVGDKKPAAAATKKPGGGKRSGDSAGAATAASNSASAVSRVWMPLWLAVLPADEMTQLFQTVTQAIAERFFLERREAAAAWEDLDVENDDGREEAIRVQVMRHGAAIYRAHSDLCNLHQLLHSAKTKPFPVGETRRLMKLLKEAGQTVAENTGVPAVTDQTLDEMIPLPGPLKPRAAPRRKGRRQQSANDAEAGDNEPKPVDLTGSASPTESMLQESANDKPARKSL